MVDAWQLLFISASSLFPFTGLRSASGGLPGLPLAAADADLQDPARAAAGVPGRALVAGDRPRRAGGIGVLLAIGQLLYGTLMGFGYPLAMLTMGGDTVSRWSTHFENNSVRGLLFKIAAGFRLPGQHGQLRLLSPTLCSSRCICWRTCADRGPGWLPVVRRVARPAPRLDRTAFDRIQPRSDHHAAGVAAYRAGLPGDRAAGPRESWLKPSCRTREGLPTRWSFGQTAARGLSRQVADRRIRADEPVRAGPADRLAVDHYRQRSQ